MREITDIQKATFEYFVKYFEDHLKPPTVRQIAKHFNISIRAAMDRLFYLEKKGLLKKDSGYVLNAKVKVIYETEGTKAKDSMS